MSAPSWLQTPMQQWSQAQWESLCDGCGKCCLQRLQDEDSGEIFSTNVACRYFDHHQCSCTEYQQRSILVPQCVTLTVEELDNPDWLPPSCAYRLIAENKPLPDWHHLMCNDRSRIHREGHSVQDKVICETQADDLEHHLLDWP